ncbi:matrixin family metalloprotease [Modestobacter lacusdianchii]
MCSGSTYDLRGVTAHEWGHAFGLDHTSPSGGLVMKPSIGYCDTSLRSLGRGDQLGIDFLYWCN